jgi:lipopolysaccharide export system protein LptA
LTYSDTDRRARFTGGVVMKGQDATVTADRAEVILVPRVAADASRAAGEGVRGAQSQPRAAVPHDQQQAGGDAGPPRGPSPLQQIVAEGNVVITEPTRKATGQKLVYTSAEEKFVLTGGPPVITDTEHGRITGQSLTFYGKDDRVVVEGSAAGPLKSSK